MINLDRTNINMRQLRENAAFNKLLDAIRAEFENAREDYENNVASEYNRGRVSMLKELLSELTRNATGNIR